jgi:hypothetical protein
MQHQSFIAFSDECFHSKVTKVFLHIKIYSTIMHYAVVKLNHLGEITMICLLMTLFYFAN